MNDDKDTNNSVPADSTPQDILPGLVNTLNSVEVNSEEAKLNETTMIDSKGKIVTFDEDPLQK